MNMNPNFANREVADLVMLDYVSKKPYLNVDFANATATDFTATRVFAKGGQGAPNRVGFDGERTGTLKVTTQIMPAKLFAMLSGGDIGTTCKSLKREVLTATETSLTLSEEPITGTVQVFKADDDCGVAVSDASVQNTTVTVKAPGTYVVYYFVQREENVMNIKFNATNFPKAFEIHGKLPFKNEDDEIAICELVYYRAVPQSTFSLSFSNTGDPTSIDITFDCFADGNGDIYDMNFIDEAV